MSNFLENLLGNLEKVEVETTKIKGQINEDGLTLNFKGIKTEKPKELRGITNIPLPEEIGYRLPNTSDVSDDFDENDEKWEEYNEDEIYED